MAALSVAFLRAPVLNVRVVHRSATEPDTLKPYKERVRSKNGRCEGRVSKASGSRKVLTKTSNWLAEATGARHPLLLDTRYKTQRSDDVGGRNRSNAGAT